MTDLRDLYQEVLLDHSKRPRNFGVLEDADHTAVGHNPLCGDKVVVYLRMEGDRIAEIRFQGQGCAVSQASASMMTESVKGKTRAEAEALFERFHELLTSKDSDVAEAPELGKLAIFAGVRKYPVRVKCATLAWHTLRAALEQKAETVSTE
ncbi:MAG: SUF system NifU family Fe-S cluster assembly protein [Blastocatellia bacterium]|nr:SUF system NifU family Fe-S cluster assembly protein [Blastocatellia bacterium]MCS7156705.1 SUF system NifU family Fe-S cluster assembly protein [Blastocatellia bacterium]MCX7751553.1 SUF system NifU family Fe-S cluster assembly protein [Blastocatellia bacterium]MDW8168653.1 SUF system NifU family Fe-S cluster assembly protein [Acidobacteriota bacterium]MDW8256548.1 SUF system NifU family Fe-S cluster assembly protein [Acidobacteriota bacterium]